ncbi:MAG: hypothetical protein FWD50_07000 [Betaproteobacteria bacterium]|nr:hypothetical protein [Betaproteobacteria bacterium]
MSRTSITSFRALLDVWPDIRTLTGDFVVPYETTLAARELHGALQAAEFLHRQGACAERTVHVRRIPLCNAGG